MDLEFEAGFGLLTGRFERGGRNSAVPKGEGGGHSALEDLRAEMVRGSLEQPAGQRRSLVTILPEAAMDLWAVAAEQDQFSALIQP